MKKLIFNRKPRFNEKNELSNRYVEFNLQQLIKVAVNTCNGAQSCMYEHCPLEIARGEDKKSLISLNRHQSHEMLRGVI